MKQPYVRRRSSASIAFLLLAALACNVGTPASGTPTAAEAERSTAPAQGAGPAGRCGDGVCEGPENAALCPADCRAEQATLAPESTHPLPSAAADVYLAVDQASFYEGVAAECWYHPASRASVLTDDSGFAVLPGADDGSAAAPILFTVIVHIEPHASYADAASYRRDRDRLTRLADIFAAHDGKLTIQSQRPFITTSQLQGDDVHRAWEAQGHEIAIHFHENEYVADNAPTAEWAAALGGLRDEIQGLVERPVVTWSGGNLYPTLWEAAEDAGLWVNTNFKNRFTQETDPLYMTVSPWRPAGTATDAQRAAHAPEGPVVYLPAGVYPAHCDKAAAVPRPYTTAAFDYVSQALLYSLQVARPGFINVAYTTMHPGDFQGPDDDEAEFTRWDEWLTTVIDPLLADGRLRWASSAEMAATFAAWESAGK